MFFFIAGVQPRTLALEDQSRNCPSCGILQARLKRMDHYFSLFFIPLLRVRKGNPFLECSSCGILYDERGEVLPGHGATVMDLCPYCGERIEPDFHFCPFCGKKIF